MMRVGEKTKRMEMRVGMVGGEREEIDGCNLMVALPNLFSIPLVVGSATILKMFTI